MKKKNELAVKEYDDAPEPAVVESVAENVESIVVQRGKHEREERLMALHEIGGILRDTSSQEKVNISALISSVARDGRVSRLGGWGERTLWFSLKVFDTFPEFKKVYETEHGENISATKLKRMLTEIRPKKEPTSKEIAEKLIDKLGPDVCRQVIKELEKILAKIK